MKGLGLLLLIAGIAAYLIATSQRSGYETAEGKLKTTFSQSERGNAKFWGTARWVGVGIAGFGLVLFLRGTRPR